MAKTKLTTLRWLLIGVFLVSLCTGVLPVTSQPETSASLVFSRLEPSWTTGILSDSAGLAGTEVADVNGDGLAEILTCNGSSAYALNYAAPGEYTNIWFSPLLECNHLALITLPGGARQIILSGADKLLTIFNGADFSQQARFATPDGVEVHDLLTGDVDKDGVPEIVLVAESATYILNGQTYAVEWKAAGRGGFQAGYGNIDNDPAIELVVNSTDTAYILNPAARTTEWSRAGSFGRDMALGDIDGDGRAEIVYTNGDGYVNGYVYAFEADLGANKWAYGPMFGVADVEVAEVNGSGAAEVLAGNTLNSGLIGINGVTGLELFYVPNPLAGTYGISAGDTDNDGVIEIVFGGGAGTDSEQGLVVGDWQIPAVEWQTTDLNGPLFTQAADVDNDGEMEVVLVSAGATTPYFNGVIQVYDAATYRLEWTWMNDPAFFHTKFWKMDVGQLDTDPALEIVAAVLSGTRTLLFVFDGTSGELEWASNTLGENFEPVKSLRVAQLDGDPVEEIICAMEYGDMLIFNGAGGEIQWDMGNVGWFQDVTVGDVNGNGIDDLVLLTYDMLRVYNVSNQTILLFRFLFQGKQVAVKPPDASHPGMYLVYREIPEEAVYQLRAYSWAGFELLWERKLPPMAVAELLAQDLEGDGVAEVILAGAYLDAEQPAGSLLQIHGLNQPEIIEYTLPARWGDINQVQVVDVDGDSRPELLFSADSLIQVNTITAAPITRTIFPNTGSKACTPRYADTFSDPASGWPIGAGTISTVGYVNGEYTIRIITSYALTLISSGATLGDGQVIVDVRNPSPAYGTFGILFGLADDWTSFYTFEIDMYGDYFLYMFQDEIWTLLTAGISPALLTYDATNHLRLERSGETISLYANETLLTTWTGANYTGELEVGLIASAYEEINLEVFYDNFAAYHLGCGTQAVFVSTPFSYGLEGLRAAVSGAAPESWLSGVNPRR